MLGRGKVSLIFAEIVAVAAAPEALLSNLSNKKRRVWAHPGVFRQFGCVVANHYELA
jgi:hypothetical protein